MRRCFDHVDLRVRSFAEARPFYEALLPALGFTLDVTVEGWLQFEAPSVNGATEFFGVKESPQHVANECRIAFWADSISEVDRLAQIASHAGARNVEGPTYETPNLGKPCITPSFSRTPAAIVWKSVTGPLLEIATL
jgi:catechol 2,3-dioxygenase-like lactoylglutathione lyase family enzyme